MPAGDRALQQAVRAALAAQPTLVLADNLESVLPKGEAPLEADERRALWDTQLALKVAPARACCSPRGHSRSAGQRRGARGD